MSHRIFKQFSMLLPWLTPTLNCFKRLAIIFISSLYFNHFCMASIHKYIPIHYPQHTPSASPRNPLTPTFVVNPSLWSEQDQYSLSVSYTQPSHTNIFQQDYQLVACDRKGLRSHRLHHSQRDHWRVVPK